MIQYYPLTGKGAGRGSKSKKAGSFFKLPACKVFVLHCNSLVLVQEVLGELPQPVVHTEVII